jgi:hypothetical protein
MELFLATVVGTEKPRDMFKTISQSVVAHHLAPITGTETPQSVYPAIYREYTALFTAALQRDVLFQCHAIQTFTVREFIYPLQFHGF